MLSYQNFLNMGPIIKAILTSLALNALSACVSTLYVTLVSFFIYYIYPSDKTIMVCRRTNTYYTICCSAESLLCTRVSDYLNQGTILFKLTYWKN